MTIPLMSRGYLCPSRVVEVLQGPGPEIIGVVEPIPGIDGGLTVEAEGPTITGAVQPGPSISGSSGATDVGDEAPSISGADKPKLG